MLELIVGIIIGATFADFWRYLYKVAKQKASEWMSDNNKKPERFE